MMNLITHDKDNFDLKTNKLDIWDRSLTKFISEFLSNTVNTIDDFSKSMIPIISGFFIAYLLYLTS